MYCLPLKSFRWDHCSKFFRLTKWVSCQIWKFLNLKKSSGLKTKVVDLVILSIFCFYIMSRKRNSEKLYTTLQKSDQFLANCQRTSFLSRSKYSWRKLPSEDLSNEYNIKSVRWAVVERFQKNLAEKKSTKQLFRGSVAYLKRASRVSPLVFRYVIQHQKTHHKTQKVSQYDLSFPSYN